MVTDLNDEQGPISLELLKKAVDASNDGIVIAEQEGDDNILIYVNKAFERLTGYSAEEILYQDCRFLQGEDTQQESIKVIRKAIDGADPVRTILKNYRKDGSVFWNELSVTPYFDEIDELTYYIGIQKDVTEEEVLQEALDKVNEEIGKLEDEVKSIKK